MSRCERSLRLLARLSKARLTALPLIDDGRLKDAPLVTSQLTVAESELDLHDENTFYYRVGPRWTEVP